MISVYEGDVYDEPESPENVKLAEIPWEFSPPRTRQDGALDVTFEYGDDGILTVQIHDPHTGQKRQLAIQQAAPRRERCLTGRAGVRTHPSRLACTPESG